MFEDFGLTQPGIAPPPSPFDTTAPTPTQSGILDSAQKSSQTAGYDPLATAPTLPQPAAPSLAGAAAAHQQASILSQPQAPSSPSILGAPQSTYQPSDPFAVAQQVMRPSAPSGVSPNPTSAPLAMPSFADSFAKQDAEAKARAAQNTGDFAAGWESGVNSLKGLGALAVGAAGRGLSDLTGGAVGEGMHKWGVDTFGKAEKASEPYQQGRVSSLGDAKSVGDVGRWAAFNLGNLAPSMLESVGAGALGALAGTAMAPGAGTVAEGVAAAVAKGGLKTWLRNYMGKQIAASTGKAATEKQIGAALGAGLGVFASEYTMGVGDTYRETLNEQGVGNPGTAFLAGIPYALASTLADLSVVGRLIKGEKAGPLVMRVLKAATNAGLKEGSEEAFQEMVNLAAGFQAGKTYDTHDILARLGDNFAAGALGGVVLGGAGGFRHSKTLHDTTQQTEQLIGDAAAQGPVEGFASPDHLHDALQNPDTAPETRAKAGAAVIQRIGATNPQQAEALKDAVIRSISDGTPVSEALDAVLNQQQQQQEGQNAATATVQEPDGAQQGKPAGPLADAAAAAQQTTTTPGAVKDAGNVGRTVGAGEPIPTVDIASAAEAGARGLTGAAEQARAAQNEAPAIGVSAGGPSLVDSGAPMADGVDASPRVDSALVQDAQGDVAPRSAATQLAQDSSVAVQDAQQQEGLSNAGEDKQGGATDHNAPPTKSHDGGEALAGDLAKLAPMQGVSGNVDSSLGSSSQDNVSAHPQAAGAALPGEGQDVAGKTEERKQRSSGKTEEQVPRFVATHILQDGTPVQQVGRDLYVDAQGNEAEDPGAEPISSTQPQEPANAVTETPGLLPNDLAGTRSVRPGAEAIPASVAQGTGTVEAATQHATDARADGAVPQSAGDAHNGLLAPAVAGVPAGGQGGTATGRGSAQSKAGAPHINQQQAHRLARRVDAAQARVDRLAAQMDALDQKSGATPGSFNTGRSNQSKSLTARRRNLTNKISATFAELQNARSELERAKALHDGYVSGERHPNGQLRVDAPSRQREEQAAATWGDFIRATVRKGDRVTFTPNPSANGHVVAKMNDKTINLGGTNWKYDNVMPWKDGKQMSQKEALAAFKAWRESTSTTNQETANGLQTKEGRGQQEAADVVGTTAKDGAKQNRNAVNPATDDIVTAVAKLGGLRLSELQGTALSDHRKPVVGVKRLVHNGQTAKSLADMEERLRELGYQVRDENDLMDQLDRAVRGQRVISNQGAEAEGERQLARYNDQLEAQQNEDWSAFDDWASETHPPQDEERATQLRLAGIHALGEDAFEALDERPSIQHADDNDGYLNALEDAINEAQFTVSEGQAERGGDQAARPGFSLTGESQADLTARAADEQRKSAEDAARLKSEDAKRKADASVAGFDLSPVETNPEAQKAADAGQQGLDLGELPEKTQQAVQKVKENAGASLKYARIDTIDTPFQGSLGVAQKHLKAAQQVVRELTDKLKSAPVGAGARLRMDLLKAKKNVNELKDSVAHAKRGIEARANELGLTTIKSREGDIRFHLAYHGTPSAWSAEPGFPHGRPRLDFISDMGLSAAGWGFYSTQTESTAQDYRDLDRFDGSRLKGPTGALYKLDIPNDVMPHLLDWSAPISEQPDAVRSALMDSGLVSNPRETGADVYRRIATMMGSKRSASELMAALGIPGNVHPDVSIDAKGNNYVIWDQGVLDRIATLERNGKALDALARASLGAMTQAAKPKAGESASVGLLKQLVAKVTNGWSVTSEMPINVVRNERELPDVVREKLRRLRAQNASVYPKAVMVPGDGIYLVAGNLANPREALEVLAEELVGHYGVRRAMGVRLNPLLDTIAHERADAVTAMAKAYGLDMANEEQRREAAEEYLAHMARWNDKADRSLLQRVYQAIRDIVRSLGMSLRLSDSDLRSILAASRRYVERGGEPVSNADRLAPAFSAEPFNEADYRTSVVSWAKDKFGDRKAPDGSLAWQNFVRWFGDSQVVTPDGDPLTVYHGSSAYIEEFDPSLSGANYGENAGLFFTSDPEEAAFYGSGEDLMSFDSLYENVSFNYSNSPETEVAFESNDGNGYVYPLLIKAERLYIIDAGAKANQFGALKSRGMDFSVVNKKAKQALDSGEYDAVKIENIAVTRFFQRPTTHFIVRNSENIKSEIGNDGSFSDSPDIRFSLSDIRSARDAADLIQERYGNWKSRDPSVQKVNRWFRTVGTPRTLAKQNPETFGPAYQAFTDFSDHVTTHALNAQQLASGWVANMEGGLVQSFKSAQQVRKAMKPERLAPVVKAINETTRIYKHRMSEAELMAHRLDAKQQALYNQFFNAAHHSLDQSAQTMQVKVLRGFLSQIYGAMPKKERRRLVERLSASIMDADTRRSTESARELLAPIQEQATQLLDEARAGLKDAEQALKDAKKGRDAELIKQSEDAVTKAQEQVSAAKQALSRVNQTEASIVGIRDRVSQLKNEGYAPLMRFGRFTLTIYQPQLDQNGDPVVKDGNTQMDVVYHGQYETEKDLRQAKRLLEPTLKDGQEIVTGTRNQEAFRLFGGLNMDTLALFADQLDGAHLEGADRQQMDLLREYIRLGMADQSALKRQLERGTFVDEYGDEIEGIPGFSEDAQRVLTSYILSNARLAAANLYSSPMRQAVDEIPKTQGDLAEYATRLMTYLQDPQEEFAGIRSFLFYWYLGASVSSAVTNLSQLPLVTAPYLTQFPEFKARMLGQAIKITSAGKGHSALAAGTALGDAYLRAEREGTIAPQEIYAMMAAAQGGQMSGGAFQRLLRHPNAQFSLQVLSSLFSRTEQINRSVTFIAAYKVAEAKGLKGDAAFRFADEAVKDTQFVYRRENRPEWARGVGAPLMVFKSYMINMIEMLVFHLPPKQKAVMLAAIVLAAGIGGAPGEEDIEDILDTIMQMAFGKNWNTRAELQDAANGFFGSVFGDTIGEKLGDAAIKGLPFAFSSFDFSRSLGVGNLIPGTAMLKPSTLDKTRELADVAGPVAGVVQDVGRAIESAGRGEFANAGFALMPRFVKNLYAGVGAMDGTFEDRRGMPQMELTALESIGKAMGFQPSRLSRFGEIKADLLERESFNRKREDAILDKIARGKVFGKPEMVRAAQDELNSWNARNPNDKITFKPSQVQSRVRNLRMMGDERFLKTLSPERRKAAAEALKG